MARRKKFTANQYATRWEAYDGKCHRCGIALDKHKRDAWHWGHILGLGCGGEDVLSNVAPECRGCNEKDAREHVTPLAAKIKRVRNRHLGIKKPKGFRKPTRSNPETGELERWTGFRWKS